MNSPQVSRRFSRLLRRIAFVVLSVLAVKAAATGIKSERLLAAIINQTPDSTLVAEGQQMERAEAAAAAVPGGTAMWGVGASMEPLYSSRTAIVVAPIPLRDLKKGMTVVYLNRRGRMVAHSLIGDLPGGWIAQGVNNAEEDDDLVTSQNLVGVIVGAYSDAHSEFRLALTKELTAKGRLASSRT